MPTLDFTFDKDGEEVTVALPARWEICHRCDGDGKSSIHLGAFTGEQLAEDPDFAEDYFSGVYDRPCNRCNGTGKVLEINREASMTEEQQAALAVKDEIDADRAEMRSTQLAEMRAEGQEVGPEFGD